MDEQLEFVKQLANRLDSAGFPYMMTGSMAVAVYAVPRMTRDIDIVVEYQPKDAEKLAGLFERDCYVDLDSVREAAVNQGMFNIIHNEWFIKADFIARKNDAYRKTEFERRRTIDVEGTRVAVVSPEDLILSKLFWARDSGSEMQQRDARQIIESAPDLDWSYLEKWAAHLSVTELLQRNRR
jgi:predicted nucleotidyltransferase